MCTAIHFGNFFGRTLDLECSFGEEVVVMPRGSRLSFIYEGERSTKHKIIGTAHLRGCEPLFYDAINEAGVGVAALNFPKYALYRSKKGKSLNLASFEVISYILSECDSVSAAKEILAATNVTDDDYGGGLNATPLHWMIADKNESIVFESTKDGCKVYDNPYGVITNAPSFEYQITRLSDFMQLVPSEPENLLVPRAEIKPYSRGMGAVGLPGDYSSSSRFIRAVFVKENTILPEGEEIEGFFHVMDSVSVPLGCIRTDKGEPVSTL